MQSDPRYEVILYWSAEDEAFIAEVPELPGCAADGPTYEAALANVRIIIDEWIETAEQLGRVVPEPRGRLLHAELARSRAPVHRLESTSPRPQRVQQLRDSRLRVLLREWKD